MNLLQKTLANNVNDVLTFDKPMIVREIYYSSFNSGNLLITFDSSGPYATTPTWSTKQVFVRYAANISFRVATLETECKSITFLSSVANTVAVVLFDEKK
jgi:hypothetical protein